MKQLVTMPLLTSNFIVTEIWRLSVIQKGRFNIFPNFIAKVSQRFKFYSKGSFMAIVIS